MSIPQTPILRPMTADDRTMYRASHPAQLSPLVGCLLIVVLFLTWPLSTIALGWLAIYVCKVMHYSDVVLLSALGFSLLAGFGVLLLTISKLSQPEPIIGKGYNEKMADGQVAVYQYTASTAARLQGDIENDVPAFVLQVGDGQLLYLEGAYLAEPAQKRQFPCDQFEVIRLLNTGKTLRISCMGNLLDAVRTIRGVDWVLTPADHEVIATHMDTLPELLCPSKERDDNPNPAPLAQVVNTAALPPMIHPQLRSMVGITYGHYVMIAVSLAFGLLPFLITGYQYLHHELRSGFEFIGSFAPASPLLLIPAFMIPWMMKIRNGILVDLRLATKTLNEAKPITTPVIVRYVITISPGPDNGPPCRQTYVRLPVDIARNNYLPREFEILPPEGEFTKMRAECNGETAGKSGTLTFELYKGPAKVYVGAGGMIVAVTSKGYLVRFRPR